MEISAKHRTALAELDGKKIAGIRLQPISDGDRLVINIEDGPQIDIRADELFISVWP